MNKQTQIVAMFDAIAKDYDKANHILSLGIDISWRIDACKKAFASYNKREIDCVLDVACGTGDMILTWHKQALKHDITLKQIIGIDPSANMLEVATSKLSAIPNAKLINGEAQSLVGIPDSSVDILSIAYGLRNVVEYQKALQEFARVLKKGGILLILDFFKKPNPTILDKITRIYTKKMLPLIGMMISKNYAAYKYLPDSMEHFISTQELESKLQEIHITPTITKGYSANISHLILGIKQ